MVGFGSWREQGKPSGKGIDLRKSMRAGICMMCYGSEEAVLDPIRLPHPLPQPVQTTPLYSYALSYLQEFAWVPLLCL